MPKLKQQQANLQAIRNVAKAFGLPEVRAPKTESRQMRSLVQRGLAKRTSEGKLVLTDRGRQKLKNFWGVNYKEVVKLADKWRRKYPDFHIGDYRYEPWTYAPILTVLKRQLGQLKGKMILELGFGGISFLQELRKRGAIVAGIDIIPSNIDRHPKEIVKKLNLKIGNVTELDKVFKEQKFDAIVAREFFDVFSWDVLGPFNRGLVWKKFLKEGTLRDAFKAIRNQLNNNGILICSQSPRWYSDAIEALPPNLKFLYSAEHGAFINKIGVFKAI